MRLVLPDLYDPPEPLEEATPFPIYHIEGTGSFAAINGKVDRTSAGAAHLKGRTVREVLEEAMELEAEVLAVEPRKRDWKKWAPRGPLYGPDRGPWAREGKWRTGTLGHKRNA